MNRNKDQRKNKGSQACATQLGQFKALDFGAVGQPLYQQQLMAALEQLGSKRLVSRRKEAQRLLRENGATHNVFDPEVAQRGWQFDPIPQVISNDEWQQIEAGLVQRAKLLNCLLADIYGAQTVLKKGLLPPELIFAHKGFLWPCVGLLDSQARHLNLYSAKVARGKDGRFWVLEDNTQPLFGSGYALENRVVMTRSFSRLFQDFQVHRLAMYFRALRNSLTSLARKGKIEPTVVVLTPGPESDVYFEHSYLAAYLGYALVQGGDLIVRDGCVWLKTVSGLSQVDVILRRLDDELCDPLELRGDSLFGVAGLLEAVRLGNVVTANPIGSSVIENPALLSFLPGLARHFLGEELLLPAVATWWCGQPREREFVLQNLDNLVIKSIHPLSDVPEGAFGDLEPQQQQRMRQRIIDNPHLFVGQELASLAAVPCFVNNCIEQRPSVLSTFIISHQHSYVVMPGGLTQVNLSKNSALIAKEDGRGCKDTWVLTTEIDKQVNLWRQVQPDQLIQPLLGALPSRAAENLYWAGRYAERTEATARLFRSILTKLREFNEFRDPDDRRSLDQLLRVLTHVTSTYPGFTGEDSAGKLADPRVELLSLACDANRAGSLRSSLRRLSQSAYPVRDLLPEDAWRVVENTQLNWNPKMSSNLIGSGRLHDSINQLILQLSAFSGLTYENMSRETAWLLLNIGRRLERAQNLIELLRETLVPCYEPSIEAQIMETVLTTCNSLIVYRRRYRSFMQLATVLELLLLDDNYPRALAAQLQQLQQHIQMLPHDQGSEPNQCDENLISQALVELRNVDHIQLTQLSNQERIYPLLDKLLVAQKSHLDRLSGVLINLYFSPTQTPQQLSPLTQDQAS